MYFKSYWCQTSIHILTGNHCYTWQLPINSFVKLDSCLSNLYWAVKFDFDEFSLEGKHLKSSKIDICVFFKVNCNCRTAKKLFVIKGLTKYVLFYSFIDMQPQWRGFFGNYMTFFIPNFDTYTANSLNLYLNSFLTGLFYALLKTGF